jgi:predicted RNase H-like HicB family nuclease
MPVPDGYIGFVEELPGANTQGDTLEEARENLREAVEVVLEANRELAERSLAGQSVIRGESKGVGVSAGIKPAWSSG